MARRRLVRNTSASASDEKKSQPTPKDESKEETSDQNTTRRRSRRNVATSENDAQEQEESLVQEEAKEKEKKEITTPVRSTRMTRRSQVIATSPEEETKETEKTPKVEEVKKQVASPTVKSTRQSRRTNAKSAVQEDNPKAHDEAQELGAPSEDKLQTPTRSGRQACRAYTNDTAAKTEEKKDESAEVMEVTPPGKQQIHTTKTVRQSPRANVTETALDRKELSKDDAIEIKESTPLSNQQKKIIKINRRTKVDDTKSKDEQEEVQESATNVEEIEPDCKEETHTRVTEGEGTPTKVTRRINRGKTHVPAEGEMQTQNEANAVKVDSLENEGKSPPILSSPRQTRRLNTKSPRSLPAKTTQEIKSQGKDSNPEVKETNQQRIIKGKGKGQQQSAGVRDDDPKESIPVEVTSDDDTKISQEPMECDTFKEESAHDYHNQEDKEELSEEIKKEGSNASIKDLNAAESFSYQKKGKNKETSDLLREVTLTKKSCKEEQKSFKEAGASPIEGFAASAETVESYDMEMKSEVGKATSLENKIIEDDKDSSLKDEKKEECGNATSFENIKKEESGKATSLENSKKKEEFGEDTSLENYEKKVAFGKDTSLETNEKKEESTKKYHFEEESSFDNGDFLIMDEELDYEYQNEDNTENSFTGENQKKASDQSTTEAPTSVHLEAENTSDSKDEEEEAEESREKEETALDYNKETEELDYEMSEEEKEEEDNESLAPDELVIMEEDPEYMSIYVVDESDDKNEKTSEKKSSKGDKRSKCNQSRDSRERGRDNSSSKTKEKDKDSDEKERKDDSTNKTKDSRKKEDSRRSRSRDREKRSKRERSRDRDRRERSRDRDRRERSRDRDRRERSRERDRRERSRDKDRRSRSRDKDRRSRSRDKDRRSRSRDKDRRSRSRDKDRRSRSHEREKRERSRDREKREGSHKLSSTENEVSKGDVKTKDSENHGSFSRVCLLANPYYKQQLKDFEKMRHVDVRYSEQLTSDTLSKTIQLCKRDFGRNTLYIVISGIYTVTKFKVPKSCKNCKNPLRIVTEASQSLHVDELVQAADAMCVSVQKELSSDEMITMVPPLPAHLADADHHHPHDKLHNACLGLKLYGNTHTLDSLEKSYNKFCKNWIETACKRISLWGDESYFRWYARRVVDHMYRSIQKPILFQNAMRDWSRSLKDFIGSVANPTRRRYSRLQIQKENLEAEKQRSLSRETKTGEQNATDGKFEKVALIGNTDYTKSLQELTKDLNVVHVNENIDFDDDGVAILKKLQEKCTARTLWIILSGISEVAEPVDDGPPKCKILDCRDPIPTYVTKNDKLGDPEYKGMSAEKMVETSVNVAFDFAISASGKLKDDCALFLAPIMPLRGIWAGHATSHSHDALHQMYRCNPNIPHLIGNSSMWINSAKALENAWLEKIMENLSEDSVPYKLMDKYRNSKPAVFGYVEDVTLPEIQEVQEQWAELMSQIIRYYLKSTSEVEQGTTDLQEDKKAYQQASSATSILQSPYPQEPVPLLSLSVQDPLLMTGPASVMPSMVQGATGLAMVPPGLPGSQPAYSSGVQGAMPQIPGWLPNNSSVPPMVYGPQIGAPGVPIVEAAPQILPAPSVLPVTSDTQSANSGCTIQAAPKLNATMKGHLVVENMETKLTETQVKSLCQEFGEIEDLKWPQNDKAARRFLMIHYAHRRHAERAQRILNYLKVFGESAKVKLIGSNSSEEEVNLKSEDMELLMSIHNALDRIRKGSKVDRGENRSRQAPQYVTQPAVHMNYTPPVEMDRLENISIQVPHYLSQPADHMSYTPPVEMDRAESVSRQAQHYLTQPADQMNFTLPVNTYQQLPLQNSDVPMANMAYTAPPHYIIAQGALDPPKLIEPAVPQMQPELTHTVIVKNFPQLVPLQDINDMFVELGAVSKGVLIANALHFTFKEDPTFLKALSGFRFYDKLISIEVKGSDNEIQFSSAGKKKAAAKYKEPVLKVMNGIAAVLKENIDNELNVYTFKTRSCRYSDGCKEKDLCHKFHSMSDRRRCPIVFRYSDEMCPNMEFAGSCENKDSCSFAHSAVEILFHRNNFRMTPCPGSKSRKGCNKVRRVCSDFHEGKPDMLFNDSSRNLCVEGLHKTFMYLTEAIKNLFLLRDLQCLRVLLITPTPELANLYFNCVSDLAKTCNQKICKLTGGTVEDGASVLIASVDGFRNMLNQNKGKKLDLNRLKLLILDDGERIFNNISKNVITTLSELDRNGTTVVKIVMTLEKVTNKNLTLVEKKLCPYQKFKTITDDSDVWRKESNPSTSSSGSYKNDLLEKEAKKKGVKTAKNMEYTTSSKGREVERKSSQSQKEREIERKSSKERDGVPKSSSKERDGVTKSSLKERDRVPKSSSREREIYARSKSRRDGDSYSSRDSRNSRTSSRDDDSSLPENREKMVSALSEDLEKAEKKLKKEVDKELELYIQSPEFHPEYEVKYTVFMEQYKIQYPNKQDVEHSNKLWQAFWKELVTYMLKEEYNSRKQVLEKEYQNKKEKLLQRFQEQDKQKEKLKASSKRNSSMEENSSSYSKCSQNDRSPDVSTRRSEQSQQYQSTNEKERNYNQRVNQNPGLMYNQPAASSSDKPLKISDGTGGAFSVDEAVALFFEISPALGILGPATELLCKKMASARCNSTEFCKIFADEDNKLIMQRLANKARELGEVVELGAHSLKLKLVSLYATTILRYASSTIAETEAKSHITISNKYLGVDIEAIARATYNRDPTSIVQNIKNILLSKGIVNASEEQVTEIFVAVTSAHFGMACKKPAEASVPDRMSLKREAPDFDQCGSSNKYRRQDTKSFDSWQNTRSDLSQDVKRSDQWKSGVIDSRNYEFSNPSANRPFIDSTWRSDSSRGSGFNYDQNVHGSSDFAGVNVQGSSNFAGVNSDFGNPNYSSQISSELRIKSYEYGHRKSIETYDYGHRNSVESYDYGHRNSHTQGNQSGNRNSGNGGGGGGGGGMSMLEFLSQM